MDIFIDLNKYVCVLNKFSNELKYLFKNNKRQFVSAY